ncbi:MAG TPA: hypothetical protein VFB53_02970 [Burkholderiales bacterium]|nr:hypothetical protein [Burkholderiales bacterium]
MKRLRRALRRLGAPGIAGIGVLAACAAMFFSAQLPLEARLAAARAALAAEEERAARGGAPLTPEAGLAAYYKFFATGVGHERQLERLFALARQSQLQLLQGAYRYQREPGERLARYEVALPVRGSYAQIRRFLAAALNEIPVASLDRIAFERKRAADSQVEANIRFTLFLDAQESR